MTAAMGKEIDNWLWWLGFISEEDEVHAVLGPLFNKTNNNNNNNYIIISSFLFLFQNSNIQSSIFI